MKKRKKKNVIIILIILFIVLVALIGLLKFFEKKEYAITYDGKSDEQIAENYLANKVVPQGIYKFSQGYKGDVERDTFYIKLNDMLNYLMELSKKTDVKDFTTLFDYNYEQIVEYLGIEGEEEFIKVCELISEKDIKNANFLYCQLVENTFKSQGSYTKFIMKFVYDNETEIELQISLLNRKASGKPILKISVI